MKSLMLKAAKAAGKVVLKNYGKVGKIRLKAPRSIVTKVDILSEQTIVNTISKKFPKHNFLTEESDFIDNKSKFTWIIDPIDGTTNFVSGIPNFAVSIALAKNNSVVMGVVYNPYTQDMYIAEKGKGSYLNNKRLKVSTKKRFDECVLGFSLPSDIDLSKKSLSILSRNYGTFRALRNTGSAALNLCYVADKKFDMYFTLNLHSWDVAAAKLVVEEAGGKTTNIHNKKWTIEDRSIVGSNRIIHNKFIRLLKLI